VADPFWIISLQCLRLVKADETTNS
jgi:hypothetical protein